MKTHLFLPCARCHLLLVDDRHRRRALRHYRAGTFTAEAKESLHFVETALSPDALGAPVASTASSVIAR